LTEDSCMEVLEVATCRRLFDAGWTRGMILRGAETDH